MFPESKISFAFYISVICVYIVTIFFSVQTLSFINLGMYTKFALQNFVFL